MAGGMNSKRGDHGTLADRVAQTRANETAARPSVETQPATAPTDTSPTAPVKHCWVTTSIGRHPGLLLEWRRRSEAWDARVVHRVLLDDGWVVVEEWLSADLLEPVE